TDPGQLPTVIEGALAELGGIDILVNDFPVYPSKPFDEHDDGLDNLLQLRSMLTMAACRAALPQLKKSPQGRIINIGCLRSFFSIKGEAARAHAEQDMASLTRELAAENGEFAITVNYIQPGAVMTPQSREVFRKDKSLRDHFMQSSAAGRLGESLDVAKVALFLASEDAAFVSGTGITVDGGPASAR
ncbi:MAG: SDR family oxidoreductase, partial [Woeseiaceae bacterium]|nr:SDR family oxidoreductase [Woeseiaceae bacterium]